MRSLSMVYKSAGTYNFSITITDYAQNSRFYSADVLKSMGLPYQMTYIPAPIPKPISFTMAPCTFRGKFFFFNLLVWNGTAGPIDITATIVTDKEITGGTMNIQNTDGIVIYFSVYSFKYSCFSKKY